MNPAENQPLVSVVAVNYNGKKWLEPFFASLRAQTIFDRIEVILVDNTSTDGSAEICQKELIGWSNGIFLPTGGNFGFGGGNNRGAAVTRGKYLFFINPDVRFEPDCLEKLVSGTDAAKAGVGCALILNYDDDSFQCGGTSGFDIFGNMIGARPSALPENPFAVSTFFFIRRDVFQRIGGFDEEFFLYNEEMDVSWRAWIAGEQIRFMPSARLHHQGVSSGDRAVENRTSESKRFYANRNQLLTIMKDARGLLLILVFSQLVLITFEAIAGAVLARRFSFIKWSLLKPVADCWRLRKHIAAERKRIRAYRQRGDLWMLRRFFQFKIGRWADVERLFQSGVKIDSARK